MGIHFKKAKSRDEILEIVDKMMQRYGNEVEIPMCSVDQQDGRELYACSMSTAFLHSLICRLPRDMENPEGIQRALQRKKVQEIKDCHENGRYGSPNAVVITVKVSECPYLELTKTRSASSSDILTVKLKEFCEYLRRQEVDEDGYLEDPEEVLLGYMIDGHHRTEGAYQAGRMDYEFNTSVYIDLDKSDIANIFVGINAKQEKPSAIHTNAIKRMAGLMERTEGDAYDIMLELNERSPLMKDRIKMFDGARGKELPRAYVSASKLLTLLVKWLEQTATARLRYHNLTQQYHAVEDYLGAWAECYQEAWDSSRHVLTKSMGMDIIFDLYTPLLMYVRETRQGNPAKKDFVDALHKCFFLREEYGGGISYIPKGVCLEDEEHTTPLDWSSSSFGAYSSGKGINYLKKELRMMIENS